MCITCYTSSAAFELTDGLKDNDDDADDQHSDQPNHRYQHRTRKCIYRLYRVYNCSNKLLRTNTSK